MWQDYWMYWAHHNLVGRGVLNVTWQNPKENPGIRIYAHCVKERFSIDYLTILFKKIENLINELNFHLNHFSKVIQSTRKEMLWFLL